MIHGICTSNGVFISDHPVWHYFISFKIKSDTVNTQIVFDIKIEIASICQISQGLAVKIHTIYISRGDKNVQTFSLPYGHVMSISKVQSYMSPPNDLHS